jgi:hypothetical protein
VQLEDFRSMVERMTGEIPPEYMDGIAAIEVSPRTVSHPSRVEVYTLGECIPLDLAADPAPSRVVLYHGSFRALARQRPGFDWRAEAWETLTHELRHHLEWRARTQDLEDYDWAADQGFARAEAESFDPLFFLSGEPVGPGVYQVDDDVFVDRLVSEAPATVDWQWGGHTWRVDVPPAPLPLYLSIDGLEEPPPGDFVIVIRRKPRFFDLLRRPPAVTERRARARLVAPADGR